MAAAFLDDERIAELLADRAVEGLDADEQDELDRLAGQYPDYDEEALDRVAAALALNGLRVEPMPASLRERIEAEARNHFVGSRTAKVVALRPPPASRGVAGWAGWFAAAASVVLAVAGWWRADSLEAESVRLAEARSVLAGEAEALRAELDEIEARLDALTPPPEPGPAEARAALTARPGTVSWAWTTTEDPAARGASGDVVWNPQGQEGYMRFSGLAANDPSQTQYQLWIFDAGRDDRYPVDGGVFDVPAGADEVVVPIRAGLPVGQVALFAVTVEKPGGVVVSSRERIAVLAQPPGA